MHTKQRRLELMDVRNQSFPVKAQFKVVGATNIIDYPIGSHLKEIKG